MQNLVTNKVENGYICTMDGKIWVMTNLQEVLQFMALKFNDTYYENAKLVKEIPPIDLDKYESITSDSE